MKNFLSNFRVFKIGTCSKLDLEYSGQVLKTLKISSSKDPDPFIGN